MNHKETHVMNVEISLDLSSGDNARAGFASCMRNLSTAVADVIATTIVDGWITDTVEYRAQDDNGNTFADIVAIPDCDGN